MLNITRVNSEHKFYSNWNALQNTLSELKHCSINTSEESTQKINYLDTNCFNFVQTAHKCNFNPKCIFNQHNLIKERQRILNLDNDYCLHVTEHKPSYDLLRAVRNEL
jgi:hypothetical protein